MEKSINEVQIRDFLANRLSDLRSLIFNYDKVRQELKNAERDFLQIPIDEGGPSALDLINEIIRRRNLRGLDCIDTLELIGKEFPLLNTKKPGKKPSADLLALSTERGTLLLIEVKKSPQTEREAVTELSAYSQGLEDRFFGLNPVDVVWIPICTDWNLTTSKAFSYQIVWKQESILPMKALIKSADNKIKSISLELLDLTPDFPEELALSIFSWATYDCLTIFLPKKPSKPQNIIDFIVSTASRLGYSGFVMYTTSDLNNYFPYPYGFLIAAYNPFKGYLKKRQLEIIREFTNLIEMRKNVKKPLLSFHDIDFRKDKDLWENFDQFADNVENNDKDVISISELSWISENRLYPLFYEIKAKLDLFVREYEHSYHDMGNLLHDTGFHSQNAIEFVSYFGIMQEAVYNRLHYEFYNSFESGDGPVVGDLGGDPVRLFSSWNFFFDFMDLMNYNHECQTKYYEQDE